MQNDNPSQQSASPQYRAPRGENIDFDVVDAISTQLRKLARDLLAELLAQRPLPLVDLPPDLLLERPAADERVIRSAGDYRAVVHSTLKPPDAEKGGDRDAIFTKIRTASGQFLHLLIFDPEALKMPGIFWPSVADLAWRFPGFLQETAEMVEGELRSRVFFCRGGFQATVLSLRTFWLLVCIASARTVDALLTPGQPGGRRTTRLSAEEQLAIDSLDVLVKAGIAQGLQPNWASLWDQWVLREALRQSEANAPASIDKVLQALRELPLNAKDYAGPRMSSVDLARPEWEKAMPRWFKEWEGL